MTIGAIFAEIEKGRFHATAAFPAAGGIVVRPVSQGAKKPPPEPEGGGDDGEGDQDGVGAHVLLMRDYGATGNPEIAVYSSTSSSATATWFFSRTRVAVKRKNLAFVAGKVTVRAEGSARRLPNSPLEATVQARPSAEVSKT